MLRQFTGTVLEKKADRFSIELADTRQIEFRCEKSTAYLHDGKNISLDDLQPRDQVRVEGTAESDGTFRAVKVTVTKRAPAPPPSTTPTQAPSAPPDEEKLESRTRVVEPDGEYRPVLKRGKPKQTPPSEPREPEPVLAETTVSVTEPGPAVSSILVPEAPAEDELITKMREAAVDFTGDLPNYLCQQFTTRYYSETRKPSWIPRDVVSADVVFEDGKESYRNLKINNKSVKPEAAEASGTWSTGEFASTLRDLFSPGTMAAFYPRRDSTIAGIATKVYNFSVEQRNSHWLTRLAGQSVYPAYKGSVWIDPKAVKVMRIEMQAQKIPTEFPLDAIEWVVEYAPVRISGRLFVLPVHAENLACHRGSFQCSKNTIDFRNYRKFSAESAVFTTETNVEFEGEPQPDKKVPPKKP